MAPKKTVAAATRKSTRAVRGASVVPDGSSSGNGLSTDSVKKTRVSAKKTVKGIGSSRRGNRVTAGRSARLRRPVGSEEAVGVLGATERMESPRSGSEDDVGQSVYSDGERKFGTAGQPQGRERRQDLPGAGGRQLGVRISGRGRGRATTTKPEVQLFSDDESTPTVGRRIQRPAELSPLLQQQHRPSVSLARYTTTSRRPNYRQDATEVFDDIDSPVPLPVCKVQREPTVKSGRRRSLSVDNYQPRLMSDRRRIDQSVEMPRFDGIGDLELFIQRFDMLADYYQWPEDEKLFRLKQCVHGDAQYVLIDTVSLSSVPEFVAVLRERFGTAAHAERYRTELSRLRRGTMSVEQLHLKVRSLVNKAAPGPWTALTEIYARDAFLTALNDNELRRRVMMTSPPPETLAAAYDLTLRALAVEDNLSTDRTDNVRGRSSVNKESRHACVLAETASTSTVEQVNMTSLQQLRDVNLQLSRQIADMQSTLAKLSAGASSSSAVVGSAAAATTVDAPAAAVQFRPSRRVPTGPCYCCGQQGHVVRNCPQRRAATSTMPQLNQQSSANVISSIRRPKVKVYMDILYKGKQYKALLDSGCDLSVLSSRILPGLSYQACSKELRAANSTPVPILGSAVVAFDIAGETMEFDFLVSDAVEEIIFGADWLSQNECLWNFTTSTLRVNTSSGPRDVPLVRSARSSCIRRLYAKEPVELPPYCQKDVPVSSVWTTMPPSSMDWLVEPTVLRAGVMLARTLLSPNGEEAYVRAINCGPTTQLMLSGELMSVAEAVTADRVVPNDEQDNATFEHVQCLIDALPAELTDEQQQRATKFIRSYANVFSKSSTDLGRNGLLPHRINTGAHSPVKQPLRRQPYAHLQEIERNVQELLSADVIEPSMSPWSSNVLLVKKKDGSLRFCVDYRQLNSVTIKDSYPLPRIDSCLESIGGACLFSTIDLRSGYWQTTLHPDDADKTAFVTRSGQYRFKVLAMGLTNAPGQFQRLMDLILAGLVWEACLIYLDDVIVFSSTFDQHLERLAAVFSRLAKANLKLKASKCQLFQSEVHFLGHVVSKEGISADPEKIRTVANWPQPTNLTELRSFIGLCSYYRKFISGFADIAQPLNALTCKGVPFTWNEEQEQAFRALKDRLITAPVLVSPQDDGEFVLDTDASLTGLGAVLHQRQGDKLGVIAYASRMLTKAERNYTTTRRELLAVIFGLKQFRQFLLGRHFCLRVDHSALTFLRKSPELLGQSARWLEYIEEYDFSMSHRSGLLHGNCDALSRRPPDDEVEEYRVDCRRVDDRDDNAASTDDDLSTAAIARAQSTDPSLLPLLSAVMTSGPRPPWVDVQSAPEETRCLWAQFESLTVKDGAICRRFYAPDGSVVRLQLVMPASLRQPFLCQLHNCDGNVGTTHLGVKKTQDHVSQRAYWVNWRADVEKFCRRCHVCQSVQHGLAPRHGQFKDYEANGPADRLHVDLTGPHPVSRQGSVYIMTAIDAYTRFLVAAPLKNKTAVTVASALVERVFLPFGCYRALVSDQGTEFCNDVLNETTRLMGINKLRTTAYRPSANGRIERVHRTLNGLLSKVVSDNQRDWQERLPMVVAAYNAARHDTTGYSPFFLMYGREYRTPLDLTLNVADATRQVEIDFVEQLQDRLREAYTAVNRHLGTSTQRAKRRYDAKLRSIILEPGSYAWYYCPRRRQGKYQKWRRLCTACRVERRLNDVTYCIQLSPRAKPFIAHVDRLRPLEGDPPPPWKVPQPPPPSVPVIVDGSVAPSTDATTSTYDLRPSTSRRLPARLRGIKTTSGNDSHTTMENSLATPAAGRKPRVPRTDEQKRQRRERERGPWTCPLCSRPPYVSIAGLRGHVVLVHQQYCTWRGNVKPFDDDDHRRRIEETMRAGRRHRGSQGRLIPSSSSTAELPLPPSPQQPLLQLLSTTSSSSAELSLPPRTPPPACTTSSASGMLLSSLLSTSSMNLPLSSCQSLSSESSELFSSSIANCRRLTAVDSDVSYSMSFDDIEFNENELQSEVVDELFDWLE